MYMTENERNNILQKWRPVMESGASQLSHIKNKHLTDIMCLFCEDYCIKNPENSDLPEKIANIVIQLNSIEKREVKRTFYNPLSGEIEYELDNGFIVTERNKYKKEPNTDELIYLFGIDFVRELDKQEFRENRLNKIL